MRANEKVLHSKAWAKQGNIKVQVHLDCRNSLLSWLLLAPMMRCREASFYLKYLFQALLHLGDRLDIVVVGPYQVSKMPEINVGHDERAIFVQNVPDFPHFPALILSHVFEYAHPNDEVESLFVETNLISAKIEFLQVAGWFVDSYVDAVIANVRAEQLTQGGRSTSNIKQAARPASRHLIDHSCAFLETETRLGIESVLYDPVISRPVILSGFPHDTSATFESKLWFNLQPMSPEYELLS
jgi:hypothetical protein